MSWPHSLFSNVPEHHQQQRPAANLYCTGVTVYLWMALASWRCCCERGWIAAALEAQQCWALW